jgi:two-component system chemotaxis response regulator CheB
MAKLKVLIVDDSAMMRKILSKMISEATDMEIVGQASDPFEARDFLVTQIPDVMILDIEMPKMDGLTFLDKLMSHKPFPVLIFSGHAKTGSQVALKALELGAVDILEKPHDLTKGFDQFKEVILSKIRAAGKSRVMAKSGQPAAPAAPKIHSSDYDNSKILAVASSTGGTEALKVMFAGFNGWVPPTVVVQHMPKGFTKTFAEHMNKMFSFEVKEAENGDRVQENRVLIAPGDYHMEIVKSGLHHVVKLHQEAPMHSVRPAADYLMKSVAQCVGSRALGVVLTGMGKDGAAGLLEMRKAGAYCVAQSEQTCVVYGMPAAAVQVGAVNKVLDLKEIAPHILLQLQRKKIAAA